MSEYAEYGFDQQGRYGMFVACGIWCLADVSSVSPSSEQTFTLMMASAQVVETSVNTNNSPSQDYTTNPDDQSNHNIDSAGFKPFTVI